MAKISFLLPLLSLDRLAKYCMKLLITAKKIKNDKKKGKQSMDYSINHLSRYLYLSSLYIIGKKMTVGGCMLNCIYAIIHALFSYF